MKILGSGKIDDFQKIVLSDKVVRALNVKPGDSVLFYKGGGETVSRCSAPRGRTYPTSSTAVPSCT